MAFSEELFKELSSGRSAVVFYDPDADGGFGAVMLWYLMQRFKSSPDVVFYPVSNGHQTDVSSQHIGAILDAILPDTVFFLDISPMEGEKRTVPKYANNPKVRCFFVDEHPKPSSGKFQTVHTADDSVHFYECPVNYATSGRMFMIGQILLHWLDAAMCQQFINVFQETASAVNYMDCGNKPSLNFRGPPNAKAFPWIDHLPGYAPASTSHFQTTKKDFYTTAIKYAVTSMLYSKQPEEDGSYTPFFDPDALTESFADAEEMVILARRMTLHEFDCSWHVCTFCNALVEELQQAGVPMPRDVRILFLGPIVRKLMGELDLPPSIAVTLVEAFRLSWQTDICSAKLDAEGEIMTHQNRPIMAPSPKGREVLKLPPDNTNDRELTLLWYCHDPKLHPSGGIGIRKIGLGDCRPVSLALGGNGGQGPWAAGAPPLPYREHDAGIELQAP